MEDQEDKLTLRDKFAIEVLQALIARSPEEQYDDRFKNFIEYWNWKGGVDMPKLVDEQMRTLVRAAYRIADIMREIRLIAFE